MKKKLLSLLGISLFALTLGACNTKKGDEPGKQSESGEPVKQTFTVAFEVDGERYETLRVKDGEHPVPSKPNPTKDGFKFVGWLEGTELVDLETYVVTKNVTFTASFEEETGDVLNVDDVKQEGKTYYLVMGWWETTAVDETTGEPKHTSYMTKADARMIYQNIIDYLKIAENATDEQIANISFRNYSTDGVEEMGTKINADGDVDIMFGVGANITTKAGVETNDKEQLPTGSTKTARYVANLKTSNELGVATYAWIKDTNAGNKALIEDLTEEEIRASLTINLTVVVHGDTDETTLLDDKEDVVTLPEFTAPEGKKLDGFALQEDGEVVLKYKAESYTYADLKDLLTEGQTTLDLYPVYVNAQDLVVYVQTHNTRLPEPEARLLEVRFAANNPGKALKFHYESKNATDFPGVLTADTDVVIGGKSPLQDFEQFDATNYPLVLAGAKHFSDASRYVMIRNTVSADHLELAKALYNFVKGEAPLFNVHVAYWPKTDNSWVTADEMTKMTADMNANLTTLLKVGEGETLQAKFNVTFTQEEVTTVNAEGKKDQVADLTVATQALRDGKGADLIVGCGKNIDSQTGYEDVEKKNVTTDFMAGNRYVALVNDNVLTRSIFDDYFVEVTPAA